MKSDRYLLSKLHVAKKWSWWRVRRSAKNGNKGGFRIKTDNGIVFVTISELPEFVSKNI